MAATNPEQPRTRRAGSARSAVGVLLLVMVVAIAAGIWQDRQTQPATADALGAIPQVEPEESGLADLPTAPEAGALAPNFRLETADGDIIELADLRGRPVFINFWASWCFFCLTEMPAIQRVSDEYGDAVVVLGVNIDDSPADVATYATNNGIHYPLPMDTDRDVYSAYGVRQMPTSIFIDADGVVSSVVYGVIVPDQMREGIDQATAASR